MPPKVAVGAHTAGIYADMTLDGPEIGTLVAVVDRAKNLPNRKTMGKQDPYCAMRLGKEAKKTETDKRGGQTPKWDQELRFIVHESPDYYKLKVSVFNDDKKTELIGEGWVDLTAVIIPGGGQSDTWHELQYRGRYAGEVRIELTYYDIRPRDEVVVEKRKESERSAHTSRNNTPNKSNSVEGPRQFGPREIKRRPLPADPTASSPASTPAPAPAPVPAPIPAPVAALRPMRSEQPLHSSPPVPQADGRPPSRDAWQPGPYQQQAASVSTPNVKQYGSGPYDFSLPPRGYPIEQQQEQNYNNAPINGHGSYDDFDPQGNVPEGHDQGYVDYNHSYQPSVQQFQSTPYAHSFDDNRHSSQPSFSSPGRGYPNSSPYGSSPPVQDRQPSLPGSAEGRQRGQYNRYSTSPVKNDGYRDSPLRQSMSHSKIDQHMPPQPSFEDEEEEDAPPPPPPAHRFSNARPVTQPFPQNEMVPVPMPEPLQLGSAGKKFSLDDRSPLQALERQYDTRIQPRPRGSSFNGDESYSVHESPGPYDQIRPPTRDYAQDPPLPPNREDPYQPDSYSPYSNPGSTNDPYQTPSRGRDFRRSVSPMMDEREHDPYGSVRSHSHSPYDQPSPIDQRSGMRTSIVGVPVVKPRAVSPDARSTTRKSVSPQPSVRSEAKSMSGTPFSPDSYDVFNPSTTSAASVVSGPEDRYETPQQAMEAARQREVEKLREQGPIIGNDGRIIDPSDHLPTDTWAPEPERKQKKKPEVVIRFKTRETPRTSTGYGSSPAPIRPQSMATPGYGSSPVQARPKSMFTANYGSSPVQPRPQSIVASNFGSSPIQPRGTSNYGSSPGPMPIQSSPGEFSPPRQGRNRLQKQPPQRPVPQQPYAHTHSSPAVPIASQHNSSPRFDPPRHSMSAYPLREHQNYGDTYNSSPGGSPYGRVPPVPAKIPLQASYSTTGEDRYGGLGSAQMDALAMEMSSIDIGVGNGRRGGNRTRRNNY